MRKRKTIIILAIILTCMSCVLCKDAAAISQNRKDISIFLEKSNITIEESMLTGWNVVNERFIYGQGMEQMFHEIVETLGFKEEDAKKDFEYEEDISKGTLNIDKDGSKCTITIESFKNKDGKENTYLSFMTIFNGSFDKLYNHKKNIEECFERIGLPIELDMVVIGYIPKKASREMMESIAKNILDTFSAHEIESMRNEDLISISAYSHRLEDYIISNGNKINIQIGMRYSQYYDKTYIWIGSPVVPFEY